MLYDSIDTIPAKTYFKIIESGDLKLLLSDGKRTINNISALEDAWEKLEAEHSAIEEGKRDNTVMDISKKIESMAAKYEAITYAISYLRKLDDADLVRLLNNYGFQLDGDIEQCLNRIESESEAIQIKIERERNKLPKEDKDNSKKTTFDKVVLSYGAITGLGFVDTNKISLTQYYALIETGNEKIKALESGGKK